MKPSLHIMSWGRGGVNNRGQQYQLYHQPPCTSRANVTAAFSSAECQCSLICISSVYELNTHIECHGTSKRSKSHSQPSRGFWSRLIDAMKGFDAGRWKRSAEGGGRPRMCLLPPNCPLKNGEDSQCYVMYILPQRKKRNGDSLLPLFCPW